MPTMRRGPAPALRAPALDRPRVTVAMPPIRFVATISRERANWSGADAMGAADARVRDDQGARSRAPRRAFEPRRGQLRVRDVDGLERDTELRVRAADLARDLVEHGSAPRREPEVPSALASSIASALPKPRLAPVTIAAGMRGS
jgi:hypothetical protein